MQENNSEEKTIKRPWQANAWVGIIALLFFVTSSRFLFWDIRLNDVYEPSINYFSHFISDVTLAFSLFVNPFSIIFLFLKMIDYGNGSVFISIFVLLFLFIFLMKGLLKGIKSFVWIVIFISFIRFSFLIYFLFKEYSDFEHLYYLFYTPLLFSLLF